MREQKQYPFLQTGLILLQGLGPFVSIVGLRYIINELTGAMRPNVLTLYVGGCVGLNLLVGLLTVLLTRASDDCYKKFNLMFDVLLAEKATKVDYRFIESADFHSCQWPR
jgi:hypothetical protein